MGHQVNEATEKYLVRDLPKVIDEAIALHQTIDTEAKGQK